MIDRPDRILAVSDVDLVLRDGTHVFEPAEQAAIEARWAEAAARNPRIWNGPFFLFDQAAVEPGVTGEPVFRAEGARTDFASFLHWRAESPPDPRFRHIFPVGAVVTADDRLLVGRMSRHTANPGRRYPPSGSLDPADIVTGPDGRPRFDPTANMLREIEEEIGLVFGRADVAPGFLVVPSGPRRHALVRIIRVSAPAAALETAIARHLAEDEEEELDGVEFPDFATRFAPGVAADYVNLLLAHLEGAR